MTIDELKRRLLAAWKAFASPPDCQLPDKFVPPTERVVPFEAMVNGKRRIVSPVRAMHDRLIVQSERDEDGTIFMGMVSEHDAYSPDDLKKFKTAIAVLGEQV